MTIDNDTGLAIYRPLVEVLTIWSDNATMNDLSTLSNAMSDTSRKYASALKRGKLDEALGLAVKLESYSNKLKSFTEKLASA